VQDLWEACGNIGDYNPLAGEHNLEPAHMAVWLAAAKGSVREFEEAIQLGFCRLNGEGVPELLVEKLSYLLHWTVKGRSFQHDLAAAGARISTRWEEITGSREILEALFDAILADDAERVLWIIDMFFSCVPHGVNWGIDVSAVSLFFKKRFDDGQIPAVVLQSRPKALEVFEEFNLLGYCETLPSTPCESE